MAPDPNELERFMAAVRFHESSNDYGNESGYNPGRGTAKGAYQFIDGTWNNFTYNGVTYLNAFAPKEVQDARARQLMTQYYNELGSWELVGIAWHAGIGAARHVVQGVADPSQMSDMYETVTSEHVKKYLQTAGLDGSSGSWNGMVMSTTERQDNWVFLKDQMEKYGLGELYDFAYDMVMAGSSPASILIQLRDQPAYKERFKGMADRIANGYGPISEADYIANERQYRATLEAAGLPVDMFGSEEDLQSYIANDVSPDELEWRVGMAVTATESANPEVAKQLEELYGIGGTNSELVAYYLDPDRALTYFEGKQQLEAAALSAASIGAVGTGLNRNVAERLAGQDIQPREISERMKGRGSLTQTMVGSQGLTGSEFAAAEFGLDSESVAQLSRVQQQRQGMGKRKSGAMATQGGVSGFGSANS